MPTWIIVALRLAGLGWYIALCIVLGILGGLWLGNLTGQTALLVLLGTVLGSVVAFYGAYRMALPVIYGGRRPGRPAQPPTLPPEPPPGREPHEANGGNEQSCRANGY